MLFASQHEVIITDVTFDFSVIGVMGPMSRDLLQLLTDDDLSNSSIFFCQIKANKTNRRSLNFERLELVLLVSSVGSFILKMTKHLLVFDSLVRNGSNNFGLVLLVTIVLMLAGLKKGICIGGMMLVPDDSPLQAGLDFSVSFDKEFIGKQALLVTTGERRSKLSRSVFGSIPIPRHYCCMMNPSIVMISW